MLPCCSTEPGLPCIKNNVSHLHKKDKIVFRNLLGIMNDDAHGDMRTCKAEDNCSINKTAHLNNPRKDGYKPEGVLINFSKTCAWIAPS